MSNMILAAVFALSTAAFAQEGGAPAAPAGGDQPKAEQKMEKKAPAKKGKKAKKGEKKDN